MSLTGKQLRFLRRLAQARKPVVMVGAAGLNPAVLAEIRVALAHHELLKIKLPAASHETRAVLVERICDGAEALPVQTIGRTAVVYRAADTPRIHLPR